MTKKPENDDKDDINPFRTAVRGVKPLVHTKVDMIPTPPVRPKSSRKQVEEPEIDQFSDFESVLPVGSEDIIEFARTGIQHKILRNLRNGKYNVEATLDLHGMTVNEARQALSRFLKKCQNIGIRHAKIIHGKGRSTNKPILKNKLNNWLRQVEDVLAFCSATTREGRGGALYVLLKVTRGLSKESEI